MNQSTGDLVSELLRETCRCGRAKKSKRSFCRECYFRLPAEMREDLFRKLGQGYEEAFVSACEYLGFIRSKRPRAGGAAASTGS